ncbi:MAG: hypothetical protein RR192_03130 [Peptostreptococcaceae bacterium]
MIDLNKIVNDSLIKMEEGNFVENVVKERLEKTITEIVDDVFREWSDFGKNLKSHIETNLNVDLDNLGIEGYNTLVLAAVKEQLDKSITVQGIDKIKESTERMLSDIKDSYTLSEIIETLKESSFIDQSEYDEDDKISLAITKSGIFTHIYMDIEEKNYEYRYDYKIDIDEEGKPYSIELKGNEIDKNKILGGLYGLDELLFKIYAHGSKIVLDNGMDPEDYDIYFKEDY